MSDDWDDLEGDEWKAFGGGHDPLERAMEVYKEDEANGPDLRTLGVGDRVVVRKQYLPDIDVSLCYEWEFQECRIVETTPDQAYLGTGRAGNGRKFWLDRRLIKSVVKKVDTPQKAPKKMQAKQKRKPPKRKPL